MGQPIYMVGGAKGGVGKSTVSMALLHYLLKRGEKVLLIDADTANPDVSNVYADTIETRCIDLDYRDGWMDMTNYLSGKLDHSVVINTPARNTTGIKLYGTLLIESLEEITRRLVTLWVINSQRGSLNLLEDQLELISVGTTIVLRNLYFGSVKEFVLYNSSPVRRLVEARGLSLNFPEVSVRVSDRLQCDCMTIQKIIETEPMGNRAEILRWVKECAAVFDEFVV